MRQLGVWQVEIGSDPRKLSEAQPSLERHLESWIEHDSTLVGEGIEIVGRQLTLETGWRLDLLGLDTQGQWRLIEIKRGSLYRDVVAQVLDYVATFRGLPPAQIRPLIGHNMESELASDVRQRAYDAIEQEEAQPESGRDVMAMIVGTGPDVGLDRLRTFLADGYGVPLEVVTLSYFADQAETGLLIREVTTPPAPAKVDADERMHRVLELAEQSGARDLLQQLVTQSLDLGLYPRPYVRAVMATPQDQRNRALFVAQVGPGLLRLWRSPKTLAELIPGVTLEAATSEVPVEGWTQLRSIADVDGFLNAVSRVFASASTEGAEESR